MQAGYAEIGWTLIFQIINMLLWIGILWGIYYLLFKLPKKTKRMETELEMQRARIDALEKKLHGDK
ncbi:MAG: hypothetical protein ACOYVK_19320 [Bacillota bacterium]